MDGMSPKALADLLEEAATEMHVWAADRGVKACDSADFTNCPAEKCKASVAAVAYLRQPDLVIVRLTRALPTYSAPMTLPVMTHGAGCPAREPGRYCVCGVSMPEEIAAKPLVHVAHDGLGSIADIGRYVDALAEKALPIPEQIEVSAKAWKTLNDEMDAMTRFTPKTRFMGHEEPPPDRTVGRHDLVINTSHGRIRVTVRP